VAAASADLDRVAHAFVRSNPEAAPLMPETFVVSVRPLLDSTLGAFRTTLYGLTLGVLLLLGIATVNVANLLLARATAREREMAMRTALGASRGRIVRQLLIEGLMLATVALTFGWGSAYWGLKAVIVLIPAGSIPQEAEIRLNTPVLAISLAVAAAVTVLCGLAPALHLLAVDVNRQLASRSKGSARTVRHSRLRSALVVTEIAMAVVLLAATGGLLRSFMALTGVDLGFDPGHVVYVRPWFPEKGYTADKQNAFTRQLLDRMHAMPGVSAAAESMLVPPLTYDWSDTIIPGRPHTERWETKIELCSEGYSQLFALPLMRGRWFSASEVLAKRLMVVVNDAFVRRYFPDQDPIGHRVKFQVLDRPFLDAPHDAYFEIVGVVGNYKLWADTWRAEPQAFLPYSVQGFSYRTFLARTSVDPATVIRQMTKQVWAIDPAVGVWASGSIEHSLSDFYSPPRFELATFMAFAAIGIGLALVGIFAVMTYAVSRRTNELAVRLAIGARHVDVLRLMLRDGVRLVLAGIAGGIALSYALDAVVRHRVSSVRPPDTGTALVVCVSVALVGIAACVIPTYRVLKIDVGAVLRED
jgi:putative ABC transport system permease protein